jgi:hypothetical protein
MVSKFSVRAAPYQRSKPGFPTGSAVIEIGRQNDELARPQNTFNIREVARENSADRLANRRVILYLGMFKILEAE